MSIFHLSNHLLPIMKQIMTLNEYLNYHELSLKSFADRCGLSAPTIMRLRDGKHIPSRRSLKAIIKASGGDISVEDLMQLDQPTKKET